jgi:hypothetical protein
MEIKNPLKASVCRLAKAKPTRAKKKKKSFNWGGSFGNRAKGDMKN